MLKAKRGIHPTKRAKSGRTSVGMMRILAMSLMGIVSASGQTAPGSAPTKPATAKPSPVGAAQKPPLAENVFKNVQVLKGIPVDQFMDTMGFFAAALGLNCTGCHGLAAASDVSKFADDTTLKTTARKMILMVNALNKNNFGGVRMVTCYSCHRGDEVPRVRPWLSEQYGTPAAEDPNEVQIPSQASGAASADQVFEKYVQALGGLPQVSSLTSFVGKGSYEGYDTEEEQVPVEVFAKAPAQRATFVHIPSGDKIEVYDGRAGWIAEPETPAPLMALTGGDLDGAKIEAMLFFPSQVKQIRSQWRTGMASVDGHRTEVVEGTGAGQLPLKLYFDQDSGLLVRMVRFTNTLVGQITTQVDYSDYRTVSGLKIPFQWTVTWVDGQSTTRLTDVQVNAPIGPEKFAKPQAPAN
jgi:photosynthetic reaction center cytochrome c subunit